MTTTPNLGITILVENQQHAEVVVNEAFKLIDVLLQGAVVSSRRTDAPVSATEGQAWAVPGSPTGAWSGHAGQLAIWWGGAWVFLIPKEGWRFWDTTNNHDVTFNAVEWRKTIRIPPSSGTSGSTPRPTSPIKGEFIYDNGINLPIYWNGSSWMDFAGNAV